MTTVFSVYLGQYPAGKNVLINSSITICQHFITTLIMAKDVRSSFSLKLWAPVDIEYELKKVNVLMILIPDIFNDYTMFVQLRYLVLKFFHSMSPHILLESGYNFYTTDYKIMFINFSQDQSWVLRFKSHWNFDFFTDCTNHLILIILSNSCIDNSN